MFDVNKQGPWGEGLTVCSFAESSDCLAIQAMLNSLLDSGYIGRILLASSPGLEIAHKQLSIEHIDSSWSAIARYLLQSKSAGSFLFINSFSVIERPLGLFLDALPSRALMSSHKLKDQGICITDTLLGFSLPRERRLLEDISSSKTAYLDILNGFYNKSIEASHPAATLSAMKIEYPEGSEYFQDRIFPFYKQKNIMPQDRVKYIIQGEKDSRQAIYNRAKDYYRVGEIA